MILRMINRMLPYMLMDENAGGDGGAGAGGGATSLLTPSGGGGTTPAGQGDAGAASGAGGDKPAGASGAGDPPAGSGSADWRSSLPAELQADASIKKFPSVHALAGAYVNAQKLIGADKIAVPGKHTTEEEWKGIYKKLGLPEKVEEYAVNFKTGVSIDDKFANDFKALAHAKGILPAQAQALADWFSDVNTGSEAEIAKEKTKAFNTTVTNLKKEWGQAFDLEVARANKVIQEAGGDELADHFAKSGFGADEKVLKFLAKVGKEMYGEHKFVEGQSTGTGPLTPKQIDAEINKVLASPAYFDGSHPNHKAAVQEMQELKKMKYPVDNK